MTQLGIEGSGIEDQYERINTVPFSLFESVLFVRISFTIKAIRDIITYPIKM